MQGMIVSKEAVRDEDVLREMAANIAIWACTDGTMKGDEKTLQDSDIYREITLGLGDDAKKQGWYFSSCAFLPHFVYECLGFRDPKIGRSKIPNNPLNRLAFHPVSEEIGPDDTFESGDTVWIGSNGDSHVYMVCADNVQRSILAAEYGQGWPIGGKMTELKVSIAMDKGKRLQFHGRKPARRVLRLSRLLEESSMDMMMIPSDLFFHVENVRKLIEPFEVKA